MSAKHGPLTDAELVRLAWRITGGHRAMLKSKDLWFAVAVWILCTPAWINQDWWANAISVLPSLLGFTLGGFAIFLGFGSDQFKDMIAGEDEEKAEYLSVSSAFLVCLIVQVLALTYALVCGALWRPTPDALAFMSGVFALTTPVFWGAGYLLFVLGIVLSLRAGLRIFRVSRWYNSFLVAVRSEREK